jgi:transposase-like protein
MPPRSQQFQSKIAEAEWPKVLEMLGQEHSLAHIARVYGVSPHVVKRVKERAPKRLHVPEPLSLREYPGHISPDEWSIILKRIDQGETFEHVARAYGVAPITIRRIEKCARATLGAPERPPFRHWLVPPSEWPTIVARLEQGATQRQLAKEYGVSPSTIKVVNRTARMRNGTDTGIPAQKTSQANGPTGVEKKEDGQP